MWGSNTCNVCLLLCCFISTSPESSNLHQYLSTRLCLMSINRFAMYVYAMHTFAITFQFQSCAENRFTRVESALPCIFNEVICLLCRLMADSSSPSHARAAWVVITTELCLPQLWFGFQQGELTNQALATYTVGVMGNHRRTEGSSNIKYFSGYFSLRIRMPLKCDDGLHKDHSLAGFK